MITHIDFDDLNKLSLIKPLFLNLNFYPGTMSTENWCEASPQFI